MIRLTTHTVARAARLAAVLLFAAACAGTATTAAHAQAGFRPRFSAQPPFGLNMDEDARRQAAALGDLNGDALPDLVAIEPDENRVDIYLNVASTPGTFELFTTPSTDFVTPLSVAIADVGSPFDSEAAGAPDGRPDVLVGGDGGELVVLLGVGDGTFVAEEPLEDFDIFEVRGIAVGNFDAEPGTDIALMDDYSVQVICNSRGALTVCGDQIEVDGNDLIEVVAGDFNGDGRADLAMLDGEGQRVYPLLGAGNATFVLGTSANVVGEAASGMAVDMAVTRLDGDALDDLVVMNSSDDFQFLGVSLLGTTQGRFRGAAFVADFEASSLAAADFDDDGHADVISGYFNFGLTVNINEGTGDLADPFFPVGVSSVGAVGLILPGDLNGDDVVDLLVVNPDGDRARVLLNATLPFCLGDCNADGTVSIDELMRGVGIVIGERDYRECVALEGDSQSGITVHELVGAVRRALDGCPTE